MTQNLVKRGTPGWQVVGLFGTFGAFFAIHSYAQGLVLQRQGSVAVGIVNSMRAATVSLASGLLFCSPSWPQQCLTWLTGSSAAIVTAGAVMWTAAGRRPGKVAEAAAKPALAATQAPAQSAAKPAPPRGNEEKSVGLQSPTGRAASATKTAARRCRRKSVTAASAAAVAVAATSGRQEKREAWATGGDGDETPARRTSVRLRAKTAGGAAAE